MATTRKRVGSKRGPSVESDQQPQASVTQIAADLSEIPAASASMIPTALQFPVFVLLSMVLSSILYATISSYTSGDLSTVSAHRDAWIEVGGLLAWRAIELAASWYEDFDSVDQSALTFLTHLPYLFFLTSFYKVRPTTAASCLSIDVVSTCLPFYYFRGSTPSHMPKAPRGTVANRSVINDWGVQISTVLFATGVYSVVLLGSFGTWMPKYLVTHFEGIRDISTLRSSTFLVLCATLFPTGLAAKTFLFTPSEAAKTDAYDNKIAAFDAETATLSETLIHNVWGYSSRIRTLMRRTGVLIVLVGLHTWLHLYVAVEGAEGFGAAGWSSVWMIAATLTGIGFAWVGDVN